AWDSLTGSHGCITPWSVWILDPEADLDSMSLHREEGPRALLLADRPAPLGPGFLPLRPRSARVPGPHRGHPPQGRVPLPLELLPLPGRLPGERARDRARDRAARLRSRSALRPDRARVHGLVP